MFFEQHCIKLIWSVFNFQNSTSWMVDSFCKVWKYFFSFLRRKKIACCEIIKNSYFYFIYWLIFNSNWLNPFPISHTGYLLWIFTMTDNRSTNSVFERMMTTYLRRYHHRRKLMRDHRRRYNLKKTWVDYHYQLVWRRRLLLL